MCRDRPPRTVLWKFDGDTGTREHGLNEALRTGMSTARFQTAPPRSPTSARCVSD